MKIFRKLFILFKLFFKNIFNWRKIQCQSNPDTRGRHLKGIVARDFSASAFFMDVYSIWAPDFEAKKDNLFFFVSAKLFKHFDESTL
jgi:hypothetical protein